MSITKANRIALESADSEQYDKNKPIYYEHVYGFIKGYNAAEQSSDETMIEFAEWCQFVNQRDDKHLWPSSTKDQLKLFKEPQNK